MKKYIYFILITSLLFPCCTKNSPAVTDPCTGISPKFAADVQPIINATCAINSSCHATGSVNSGGALTDHAKISGKKAEIKFQLESGQMPKTGSISTADKNKIICWINSGATNN